MQNTRNAFKSSQIIQVITHNYVFALCLHINLLTRFLFFFNYSFTAPGEYFNPGSPENRGYYFSMSPRFDYVNDENAPGPGTYAVSENVFKEGKFR